MIKINIKQIIEDLVDTFLDAGRISLELRAKGLEKKIKKDNTPVTNGDIEVNKIVTNKIIELLPSLPIISEESSDNKSSNDLKDFWLIDPIDGTKLYIAGKNTYTLNAALIIDYKPVIGLLAAPKLKKLFYSYGQNESYLLENNVKKKLNCKKITPHNEVIAVTNSKNPSKEILDKLKEYGMTSYKSMSSSYKFCVIATGEFDIYAARERAFEWDYAAGHAIVEHAGAVVTTLDNKKFRYGKNDYKNLSILIRRSNNLND